MKKTRTIVVLIAITLGILGAPQAQAAAIYTVEALETAERWTSFTVTFSDTDGDMLLSLDEVLTFSGTAFPVENPGPVFSFILGVPDIPNIADGGFLSTLIPAWKFGTLPMGGSTHVLGTSKWTYQTTQAVPEPTTLAILGLALAGLGAMRRRGIRTGGAL